MIPTQKSFLIVDDSYIDRLVASMLIKRTFSIHEISEVVGGQEALDFLRTKELHGRLILLLDIMMPRMNGFEFLERFEQLDPMIKEKVDIVILSSTFDEGDMKKGAAHPAVKKMLSKPLSANELRDILT